MKPGHKKGSVLLVSAPKCHGSPTLSLSQLMDQSLEKRILENKNGHIWFLKQNFFGLAWKMFPLVLRLRGKLIPPPIMAQSKFFCTKPCYLSITNNEIV